MTTKPFLELAAVSRVLFAVVVWSGHATHYLPRKSRLRDTIKQLLEKKRALHLGTNPIINAVLKNERLRYKHMT